MNDTRYHPILCREWRNVPLHQAGTRLQALTADEGLAAHCGSEISTPGRGQVRLGVVDHQYPIA